MRGAAEDPQSCDEAAREQATDPRRSIVLQAPAGSGKTTVLTQRLLRLLAEVDDPQEILAITFTRRAAAEMRERMYRALHGQCGSGALGERLRSLAAAVLERSSARGWRLEVDPSRLRILTIDAFNLSLANRLPLAARAGGPLTLGERPHALYALAARQTLLGAEQDEALAADADLWFERLDNRWGNLERLLAQMLAERAHWLPHVLGHDPQALSERVDTSLQRLVRAALSACGTLIGEALLARLARLPGVGPLSAEAGTLEAWQRLGALVLTQKGEWRRAVNRKLGIEYGEAAARAELQECIAALAALAPVREALLEVSALPRPQLAPQDAAALAALSRLLRVAAAQLEVRFALEGQVDYTRIAGAAQAALTEEGEPSDLALRLGVGLRHILVDEFQDTSAAQTELIAGLTAGWDGEDGRTLFVVGDPMQSIYMFREAEVGCFLAVRDRGIGALRLEPLRLRRNFRSVPALIEWCNATFGALFPVRDELRSSAVSFTPSLPGTGESSGAAAPVEVRLLAAETRAPESAALLERIVALKAADPQASIAVLVAARRHAEQLIGALQSRGVEAIGVKLVPLAEVPVVRDLVALARALGHLGDRTAWLAVLRAPWCGVTLATLSELSSREASTLPWEALNDPQRWAACAPGDRERLERVRVVLEEALTRRGRMPFVDWLEQTWFALGGADAYAADALRHARAFFTAVSERGALLERLGSAALEELLANLYAEPLALGAHPVQILTIHHAKGLEFDHVVIPGLDRRGNHDREPLLRWLDLPREQAGESDLLLAPAPPVGAEDPRGIGAFVKRLRERRGAHEQLRLLYVAATRARRSLHLYATLKPRRDGAMPRPPSGSPLARLWPALGPAFLAGLETAAASPVSAANASAAVAGQRLILSRQPSEHPPPPSLTRLPLAGQSLEPPEFSWVQETARHIGTVVHAALQQFAADATLPGPAALESRAHLYEAQLARYGVSAAQLAFATGRVLAALRATLADPRGRWILSSAHREAASERALSGLADGRLRSIVIDRSFIDAEGVRWVIDFKTSTHEGGRLEGFLAQELERYRAQLEVYRALARELGPEPVRAGLYFPLLGAFQEL
ncbi:MAG: UvrD-helicase domain-containing protein [Steroidobacteraceae bacterium]